MSFCKMLSRVAATLCCLLVSSASAQLSHSLTWGWAGDSRQADADAVLTSVINRLNAYGDFTGGNGNHVQAAYNPGVPTAQAGYGGWGGIIEYGGTYPNERVTLHELNHWLGSGTWGHTYDGPRTVALIEQFEGVGARINSDGTHFWPYGLNYDSEWSELAAQRNVALTYAMRADWGIGSTANPTAWAATSVTQTASDPVNQSGFNLGDRWSDNTFAHPNADYATGAHDLRTPQGYAGWKFAGKSLTVNQGGRFLYNSWGTDGVITVEDLRLNGGLVRHDQFSQDLFKLAGHVTLQSDATFQAAQGSIEIRSSISGNGSLNLESSGHTVTLKSSSNNYQGTTTITGGTLQLLGATGQGTTTITNGSTLTGDGLVRGTLLAESGSVVRVGGNGLPTALPGGQQRIDAFEDYPTGGIGAVPNTTGNRWTGVFDGTGNAQIVDNSGNQALRILGTNSGAAWRGAITGLDDAYDDDFSLAHGESGTYFFRVRRNGTGVIDTIFGLTDQAASTGSAPGNDTGDPWNEYAVLLSIFGDTNSSNLRAYSEGAGDVSLVSAANGQWQNVWLEVDNQNKTYRVATSTGLNNGTYQGGVYQFGRRTAGVVGDSSLLTFGIHESRSVAAELDDLYFAEGTNNLVNPLTLTPETMGEVLTIQGDLTLEAGATMYFDIGPNANDTVQVDGNANLQGTIGFQLPSGYTPEFGDSFTILSADSLLHSVSISAPFGIAFTLSESTDTELIATIVSGLAGDFNNDGVVDGQDYAVWREHYGQAITLANETTSHGMVDQLDFNAWRNNFGKAYQPFTGFAPQGAPEPASILIGFIVLPLSLSTHRPRQRRSPASGMLT